MIKTKRIYKFGKDARGRDVTEGSAAEKHVLGSKGANLAEMARIGLPVPPGFTITCQTCTEYADAGNVWPDGVLDLMESARSDLEERVGKRLGDPVDPLLVSVRSGAPFPMPGMLDNTVLNLGMNDASVEGLAERAGDARFAWDCYRRFVQMFSEVAMGLDPDLFENAVTSRKMLVGAKSDADLTTDDLRELVAEFKQIFTDNVDARLHPDVEGSAGVAVFPQDPSLQLLLAVRAIFDGWNSEKAVVYRERNGIPDDQGASVTVMAMVFGNRGDASATGVAFSRNPADGTKEIYGDYLVNAQGEDVVAGIRNTEPIAALKSTPGFEQAGAELEDALRLLEGHYRDMMDVEFTIEQGKLYMLQTRVGKRTSAAALRIAVDMADEGLISKDEAVGRVDLGPLDQPPYSQFDRSVGFDALCHGLNASPGAAVGEVVFSSADAAAAAEEGRRVVLVRWETNPDDIKGMAASKGILTSHGGMTSHAAVVARSMGVPCVCGAAALRIDAAKKEIVVAGTGVVLHEGDIVSIDGTTGDVAEGAVPLVDATPAGDLDTILSWADEIRRGAGRADA